MDGPFGLTDEPLALEVVRSMADHVDVDETALPPLAETIDTDALDTLFDHPLGGTSLPIEVTFRYFGHDVAVDGDGHVTIT